MKRSSLVAIVLLPAALAAQTKSNPLKYPAKPTVAAITPADLMSRLYGFADDSMMGRAAGTVYHDKGVDYIGREVARLGLKPGGDNGTFFQRIPLVQQLIADGQVITVDGKPFKMGADFLPRNSADLGGKVREMHDSPAVFGGNWASPRSNAELQATLAVLIPPPQAAGKVVVIAVPKGWQANRGLLTQYYAAATSIVVASLDSMPAETKVQLRQPSQFMKRTENELPSFFYASRAMAEAMLGSSLEAATPGAAGKAVTGAFAVVETPAPGSRNVIAILPGSDKKLAGQYVAIGAHSDHVGFGAPVDHDSLWAFYHVVRPNGADDGNKPATAEDWPKIMAKLDSLRKVNTARKDSIFNGADDDGTGSTGLLEIAEAFATSKDKPKRSMLFIWHVGEELGLYGSEFFTDNPTVPRDSITTELNIDMIGRGSAQDVLNGGPGYLQMIGSRRLSTELGDLMDAEAKKLSPPFTFDYQFDANGHPQQFYCRSDHASYARFGIPIVFFTTGGHAAYHQITDEPQYIDYDKLARVSQLVFNAAKTIANLDHRLVVDKPKPDPKGQCRQ